MNLKKKKQLTARTMGVGLDRIAFMQERIDEIKEAITKQDIRDLVASRAIIIKNIKGRRKNIKAKAKSFGKIKKKIKTRKEDYMKLTRKLRSYLKELSKQGKLKADEKEKIRNQIRSKAFRSKSHMKELIGK